MRESTNIEFKREWSDGIKKAMVAFANTSGGTIYIGVEDDGEVVGLDNPEQCVVQAMQAAGNAIRPDVTLCTHAYAADFEGKTIVMVEVQRGASRPYYLAEKGVRPAGVYVRQGAMSAPASESAILAMIKESANDVFDAGRSTNQDLTFTEASKVFEEAGVAFEPRHMSQPGIYGRTRYVYQYCAALFRSMHGDGEGSGVSRRYKKRVQESIRVRGLDSAAVFGSLAFCRSIQLDAFGSRVGYAAR